MCVCVSLSLSLSLSLFSFSLLSLSVRACGYVCVLVAPQVTRLASNWRDELLPTDAGFKLAPIASEAAQVAATLRDRHRTALDIRHLDGDNSELLVFLDNPQELVCRVFHKHAAHAARVLHQRHSGLSVATRDGMEVHRVADAIARRHGVDMLKVKRLLIQHWVFEDLTVATDSSGRSNSAGTNSATANNNNSGTTNGNSGTGVLSGGAAGASVLPDGMDGSAGARDGALEFQRGVDVASSSGIGTAAAGVGAGSTSGSTSGAGAGSGAGSGGHTGFNVFDPSPFEQAQAAEAEAVLKIVYVLLPSGVDVGAAATTGTGVGGGDGNADGEASGADTSTPLVMAGARALLSVATMKQSNKRSYRSRARALAAVFKLLDAAAISTLYPAGPEALALYWRDCLCVRRVHVCVRVCVCACVRAWTLCEWVWAFSWVGGGWFAFV